MATRVPRYAIVAWDRGIRNFRVLGTSDESMSIAKSRASRAKQSVGIEDTSDFTEVFTRADARLSASENLANQGFNPEHVQAILAQLKQGAAAKAAAPKPSTLPFLPPKNLSERQKYYAEIRRRGTDETLKFDLPASAKTVRADQRRRALLASQGTTCRLLPYEGGPFRYTVCTRPSGSSERVGFLIQAQDSQGNNVGYALVSPGGGGEYSMGIEVETPQYALQAGDPQGLGTRLYERAARAACKVGRGSALTSDSTRSVFSENFWRKQVRKGRAECIGDGSQSAYYNAPLNKAREYFFQKEKMLDGPEYEAFLARLPKPITDAEGYRKWPCDYYRASCRSIPDTLGKLRRRYTIKRR